MLNKKGQAFSVFELMIAAIVAVAILFILLSILDVIPPDISNNAKQVITSSLISAKTSGGNLDSLEFRLDPKGEINSEFFQADTGLDPKAVFFASKSGSGSVANMFTGATNSTNYAVFSTSNAEIKKLIARVMCSATSDSLKSSLEAYGYEDITGISATTALEVCETENFIPCCAIVLRRG